MSATMTNPGGSYATGWLEDVDLDALERFRISIGGGCLADLESAEPYVLEVAA